VRLPHGGEAWLAVRPADVRTVLGDPRFSRAAVVGRDIPRPRLEIDHQVNSILDMDPPEHAAAPDRGAGVHRAPGRGAAPRAAELTAKMLAGMRAEDPGADLAEHLSVPLPVTFICELLGVPVEDRPGRGRRRPLDLGDGAAGTRPP
jgi:cytochrome P450